MKNVKFASISDQLINTAIIMDMMFNTEVIVKVLKGGKGDMTEKRCKYCKSISVTIVPPSKEQYCTKKGKYVKLTDCCVDFFYDETAPQIYKDYGDIE